MSSAPTRPLRPQPLPQLTFHSERTVTTRSAPTSQTSAHAPTSATNGYAHPTTQQHQSASPRSTSRRSPNPSPSLQPLPEDHPIPHPCSAQPRFGTELRNREEVLGTTLDYLRALRIRYVEAQPDCGAAGVATIADYRRDATHGQSVGHRELTTRRASKVCWLDRVKCLKAQ